MTDQQAITAVKTGDTGAFDLLYQMHKRRVFSLCMRMVGDFGLAEDLTQDAFLMAFRRINSFRGDSAFSTWLHRIAVNTVLMHLRQKNSRGGTQPSLDDLTADGEPSGEVFGKEDLRLSRAIDRLSLVHAIEQLPPGYRMIFVLHDVEGYDHAEIAGLLGCSVGNTKSQLHKARLRLRKVLQGEKHPGSPDVMDLRAA
jgi:RNA polymerase sigma-70 factor (ECF subfamily)